MVEGAAEGVARAAFLFTQKSLATAPTTEGSGKLIRKINLLLDREIQQALTNVHPPLHCKPGCDHCCHRAVQVTATEALALADDIKSRFSDAEFEQLRGRLSDFALEFETFREGCAVAYRGACPLLVDGRCSAYELRPLACKQMTSIDVQDCIRTVKYPRETVAIPGNEYVREVTMLTRRAIREGALAAGFSNRLYPLGQALHCLLNEKGKDSDMLLGTALPIETAGWDLNFPPRAGETSGAFDESKFATVSLLHNTNNIPALIRALNGKSTIEMIMRMQMPHAYESEDDIQPALDAFDRMVQEAWDANLNPSEAFSALRRYNCFGLAYAAVSVRKHLEPLGRLMTEKIASKALPDLTTPVEARKSEGKLRVGYLSCNIKYNNGSMWAIGWIKNHGEDIESFVFNVGDSEDSTSAEFHMTADHYFHLRGSVPEMARFVKSQNLDVLIITDIGMDGRNYQFASLRLAPVQCTAWGHPITSGLPTIDTYPRSDIMEPEGAENEYCERLVRLPRSGLCMVPREFEPTTKSRMEFGLEEGTLVFMGQNPIKWHPKWDYLLKRIAEKTGKPVAFLGSANYPKEVIEKRAKARDLPIKLLPFCNQFDYRRLVQLADVSIDPPDWSGGNSTLEALALRVPVVTLPGAFMRGRHSYAFLKLANCEGLIAKDEDDYVDLATSPGRRATAMKQLDLGAVYNDVGVVEALDAFLRDASGR